MVRNFLRACVLWWLVIWCGACSSGVMSGAVQPGSTTLVAIPYGGDLGVQQYGFGGSLHDDPNGEMVIVLSREMLGATETVELDTLLSFAAEPPVEASWAGLTNVFGRELVIVAEVPATAPPGSWDVEIFHRLDGVDTSVFVHEAPFTVLPDDITVERPDGSIETVSGTSSQITLSQWTATGTGDATFLLEHALPPPHFGVELRVPHTGYGGGPWQTAAYAAVDVSYPAGVIDVFAVYAIDPGAAHVWFEDDGVGSLRLHGVTLEHSRPGAAVKPFRVVYTLDDPQVPLDRGDLSASLVVARDATGAPLTDPVTLEITQ